MLAMVVNDYEGRLKESGAPTTIASMLAPTRGGGVTTTRTPPSTAGCHRQ
jgi:hypothetical protein